MCCNFFYNLGQGKILQIFLECLKRMCISCLVPGSSLAQACSFWDQMLLVAYLKTILLFSLFSLFPYFSLFLLFSLHIRWQYFQKSWVQLQRKNHVWSKLVIPISQRERLLETSEGSSFFTKIEQHEPPFLLALDVIL